MVKVEWVTGRRKALARCVAIALAEDKRGAFAWDDMSELERIKAISHAQALVKDWIAGGVLACFQYDYRENDDQKAPDPITGS